MMVAFSVERWHGRRSVMAALLPACGMAAGKLLIAAAKAIDLCLWASINLIVYVRYEGL